MFFRKKITEIIEGSLNLFKEKIETKGINILKDFPIEGIEIECAPNALQKTFFNIIQNSIDSLSQKNNSFKNAQIKIKVQKENEDFLIITFYDNGTGITPKNINKIFDPFFTTKDVGEGVGLGLSESFRIIQQNFGEIYPLFEEKEGVTFFIKLPIKHKKNS